MLLLLRNAVKNCFNLTKKVIVLQFFMLTRPSCQSANIKRNGRIHNGKQKRYCKDCGRQFVQNLIHKVVSQRDKALINKLLLEKIALAADVSEARLQTYVRDLYASCPDDLNAD
jgi:hypothetical protein